MLSVRSRRKTRATIAWAIVATLAPCATALNRSLDVSQYAHTVWKAGSGFSPGLISSIAQTPDGYLWLGTEFGLRRFDGVRSVPWQGAEGEHLAEVPIRRLQAARDGRLWIGTLTGLASWKDGKLTHYPELNGYTVEALMEDREGTIWAGGWASDLGRLCRIQNGSTQCFGEDGRFGSAVTVLYEDSSGNVWAVGTTGLWRWKPGQPKFYGIGDVAHSILALVESDDGGILIARHDGIIKLRNGRAERYSLLAGANIRLQRLFRDRDGVLWIGSAVDFGLVHVHEGKTDLFGPLQGLSGGSIMCIFEDREGSIWVASGDGLDRFRDFAIPTYSVEQGLASYGLDSVLAARDGSLWIGTSHGLNRFKRGQISVYRHRSEDRSGGAPGPSGLGAGGTGFPSTTAREIVDTGLPEEIVTTLFEDKAGKIWVATVAGVSVFESGRFSPIPSIPPGLVFSITDDLAGKIWLTHERGLFRVFGRKVVERIPWATLGRKKPASALLHDAGHGGLWLGFIDGGVAYFQDGQLRASYGQPEGLAEGMVYGFSVDGNGALWAATEGGLSRIKDGRVLTLTSRNGLPCNTVQWMREDDFQSVWLSLPCGLVRIARSELDAWASHPERRIQTTVFDSSDGVKSHRVHSGYDAMVNAIVTKAADGRLWFVPFGGISVIDPHHLAFNKLPPSVHIESITANGKLYELKRGMELPANLRDLSIDFTALSLVAPEKVHFKYMLEGQDPDWNEFVNKRQVQYTNLGPRKYRFRVIASNNSGVWNETGDTLEFSIAPAYYQTNWFRALVAAVVISFLGAAYQFRIWQVQRESRRLRDVIETIPASVWSAEPDGAVDFVSRSWRELSGLSPEQGLGWDWAVVVHPEDCAGLVEAWRAAVASGKPMEAEARMRGADGAYRWQLIRSVPQHDASGKIVKWYGQTTNIDDRKRAEETLRETETRFRTYIDQATDAFFVIESAGSTVLDVNRRACESLGYTREELIGKTVFTFDAALDPGELDRIRPLMEIGESVTFETRHRRKDGSVFPVEVRARWFRVGKRTFALSLALDITERKQVEEERKRAEEERERLRQLELELAHINRVSMMGELAASVAHEVNQPLTAMVSNGSACLRFLAGDAPDVDEAVAALRDIVRDGKRAGEVIARIRALTRRAAPPKEKLDLNETVQEVLAIVGDEARKHSVVIRTQFADDLSPISGDRVQLQQVLLNLVINAVQAMSGVDERERQLLITTRNIDPDQVQVTVEDSGTGLDPNTMARIFDPFFTTKSSGMGMGLSISRSIVENHGGRLWATANAGPGTSFHLSLPQYREGGSHAGVARA